MMKTEPAILTRPLFCIAASAYRLAVVWRLFVYFANVSPGVCISRVLDAQLPVFQHDSISLKEAADLLRGANERFKVCGRRLFVNSAHVNLNLAPPSTFLRQY